MCNKRQRGNACRCPTPLAHRRAGRGRDRRAATWSELRRRRRRLCSSGSANSTPCRKRGPGFAKAPAPAAPRTPPASARAIARHGPPAHVETTIPRRIRPRQSPALTTPGARPSALRSMAQASTLRCVAQGVNAAIRGAGLQACDAGPAARRPSPLRPPPRSAIDRERPPLAPPAAREAARRQSPATRRW
jgi:hypothetical protein